MDNLKEKGHIVYLTTKFSDFVKALKSSKPSVSQDDLGKYIDWTKTFGIDGWYIMNIIKIILKIQK